MKKIYILLLIAIFLASGCQSASEADLANQEKKQPTNANFEASETPGSAQQPVSLGPAVVQEDEATDPDAVVDPEVAESDEVIESPDSQVKQPPQDSSASSSGDKVLVHDVAFAAQAPFANWNPPFDEACEEASMIMVDKFYKDQYLDNSVMNSNIIELVRWETDRGYKVDLTAAETKEVLLDFFGLTSRLITRPTVSQIKQELDRGNLIIVPAAGRQLGNPYFTPPGPIYHMLVIIGYDENKGKFITNDPGTRRGEKISYSYQTLLAANHDWDHNLALSGMTDEEMAQGSRVMVVVDK